MTTPPTYTPGIGRLAADRYDFESHIEGSDFRQKATSIDVDNPSLVYGNATTVEAGLENITAFVNTQLSAGEGFITVGTGYDTWHLANGTVNFDPSVPTLDSLLNPIFNDIINNVTLGPAYSRIQHGGIVVIKAGTYIVTNSIIVPPGITLLGEGYGTKIINASALNLNTLGSAPFVVTPYTITAFSGTPTSITVSPAISALVNGQALNVYNSGQTSVNGTWVVSNVTQGIGTTTFTLVGSTGGVSGSTGIVTTCRPVFTIAPDLNRSNNDSAVNSTLFMFSQDTRIMNIVIADNFVEAPILGDTNYKHPQNAIDGANHIPSSSAITPTTPTLIPPLVDQMAGSSLILDNVYLLGRALQVFGAVYDVTGTAVGLDNSAAGGASGSILRITDSFIDGFAFPINFLNVAGSLDYLEITNSKLRAFGFSFTPNTPNTGIGTFVFANDTNANISNNTLYASSFYVVPYLTACLYYVNTSNVSLPTFNGRSRVLIDGNNLNIDKTLATVESLVQIYDPNNLIGAVGYVTSLTFGNTFKDQFELRVDKLLTAPVNSTPISISSGPYTVLNTDAILLVTISSAAITLNLPAIATSLVPNQGLIIKDTGSASAANPIYLIGAGSDTIDYGSGTYVITAPFTSLTLRAVTSPSNSWIIL